MGLFDGATGVGEVGSSAHLAKVLNVPVILVLNVKGMAGSIVPLVKGFAEYAHSLGVTLSGIIANHVGSAHHAHLLWDLLTTHQLPPLIAWMTKNAPVLPERHLGLKRPEEVSIPDFSAHFQVDESALYSALHTKPPPPIIAVCTQPLLKNKVIAVTQDEMCCFIYPANIEWLKSMGATVIFFSLLNGDRVPEKADALWITGGYPELYAKTLAKTAQWASLNAFINADKPVLAECGGAMLLGKKLIDLNGKTWAMANIFPYTSVMKNRLVSLGYRQEINGVRGHEFHHSARVDCDDISPCFEVNRGDVGLRYKKVRASYIHWYFASAPKTVAGWLS
jgi:cobyrinic acid a,c-diamide synthase